VLRCVFSAGSHLLEESGRELGERALLWKEMERNDLERYLHLLTVHISLLPQAACWLLIPATLPAQEPPERLVIQDVHFAEAQRGNVGFEWRGHVPIWDLTGDGLPEAVLNGDYGYLSNPMTFTSITQLLKSGPGNPLWSKRYNRYENCFRRPPYGEESIFLPSPLGLRSARRSADKKSIGIFDWTTSQWKWVQIPRAPKGIQSSTVTSLTDIGDLDGDGYFDISYQARGFDANWKSVSMLSVLSGKTLKPFWTVGQWSPFSFGFFDLRGVVTGNARGTDSNGDGLLDPLVSWWENADPDVTYKCLSGMDGAILWSSSFPKFDPNGYNYTPVAARVGDQNSDGVLDLIVKRKPVYDQFGPVDPGFLKLVSGRDGSTLWTTDRNVFDPNFAAGTSSLALFKFFPWGDHNQDGFADMVTVAKGVTLPGGGYTEELWVFSGKDGAHIGTIDFKVPDLQPWSNLTQYQINSVGMLSDLDGDGWPEAETGVHNGSLLGTHLLTLSVETLRMPSEVQVGSAADFKIHIPSSPGLRFTLLFSSTFLHHQPGRHLIGNWDTQIGLDSTSQLFSPDSATRGTLDSAGWYSGQINIPAGQGLENTTIYVRGIIEDPSDPSGVRTMTTLSTIEVLP
jgi:hypothetical protein